MSKQQSLSQLVTQSNDMITVAQGEVPYIEVGSSSTVSIFDLQKVVNFLRAAVPAVQMGWGQGYSSHFSSFHTALRTRLGAIARKERFVLDPATPPNKEGPEFIVITITRELL